MSQFHGCTLLKFPKLMLGGMRPWRIRLVAPQQHEVSMLFWVSSPYGISIASSTIIFGVIHPYVKKRPKASLTWVLHDMR